MNSNLLQILSNCFLFDSLSMSQIRILASLIQRKSYSDGEYVIRQGQEGDDLYIIESGKVTVQVKGPDGKPLKIRELGPGEYFGEIGLIIGTIRSADVIAKGQLAVLVLSRENYFQFLGQFYEVQQTLTKAAIERSRVSDRIEAIPYYGEMDEVLLKLMRFELRSLRSSQDPNSSITFTELIKFYESVGFLYKDKMQQLKPRLTNIERTWNYLLSANDKIFKIFVRRAISKGKVVLGNSICAFEYATGIWQIQHLVSNSLYGFTGTLLMLFALGDWFGRRTEITQVRFTYRPDNLGVKDLFNKYQEFLGSELSHSATYDYVLCSVFDCLTKDHGNSKRHSIVPVRGSLVNEIIKFYSSVFHPVELESLCLFDPTLKKLKTKFVNFGLTRDREIFAAILNDRIVGAVICNYGSEGINFSFLESEVTALELVDDLSPSLQRDILYSLISSAAQFYQNKDRDYMVFMVAPKYKDLLESVGVKSNISKQYTVFTYASDKESSYNLCKASAQYYREHLVRKKM